MPEDLIFQLTKAGIEVAFTGLQTQPSDTLCRIGIIASYVTSPA